MDAAEVIDHGKQVEAFQVPFFFKIDGYIIRFKDIDNKINIAFSFYPVADLTFKQLKIHSLFHDRFLTLLLFNIAVFFGYVKQKKV